MTLGRASIRNTGTCRSDVKGETQAVHYRKGLSTDAEHRGGDVRIRDEGPVMGLDRRGIVIRFYLMDVSVRATPSILKPGKHDEVRE